MTKAKRGVSVISREILPVPPESTDPHKYILESYVKETKKK